MQTSQNGTDCLALSGSYPLEQATLKALRGREAVRSYLKVRFDSAHQMNSVPFSDSRVGLCGDLALLHYTVKGRSDDGQTVNAVGRDLFRFANGKLTLKDAYWKQVAWPD